MPRSDFSAKNLKKLLEPYPPEVQKLARKTRELVSKLAPDAVQEIDWSSKMIGFNFIPGTYKGLILTVSPQRQYVNIIFAKGVEMLNEGLDDRGLLEGTGKLARHIKVRNEEILNYPTTRKLIAEAVKRSPRTK
jgi:hypothetical protein